MDTFKQQFEQHIDLSTSEGSQFLNQYNRKNPNGYTDAIEMFERIDSWTAGFLSEHKEVLQEGRKGSRVLSEIYQRTLEETFKGYANAHNVGITFEISTSLYDDRVEFLVRILYLNLFLRRKLHRVVYFKDIP